MEDGKIGYRPSIIGDVSEEEIFYDPEWKEIQGINSFQSDNEVRGLYDIKNDDLYVFDSNNVKHGDVILSLHRKLHHNEFIPVMIHSDKVVFVSKRSLEYGFYADRIKSMPGDELISIVLNATDIKRLGIKNVYIINKEYK
jgi:hypothetical protein